MPQEERVGKAPPNYGAVYPCVQNILLACRAVGLGAALTTMHQVFEDELCERFAIPDEYGVVVDPETLELDQPATEALRAEMAKEHTK